MLEFAPAGLQREGQVGERHFRMGLDMVREPSCALLERVRAAGRQDDQLLACDKTFGCGSLNLRPRRRLFEHDVRVGAADAEGADARRGAASRPRATRRGRYGCGTDWRRNRSGDSAGCS